MKVDGKPRQLTRAQRLITFMPSRAFKISNVAISAKSQIREDP